MTENELVCSVWKEIVRIMEESSAGKYKQRLHSHYCFLCVMFINSAFVCISYQSVNRLLPILEKGTF